MSSAKIAALSCSGINVLTHELNLIADAARWDFLLSLDFQRRAVLHRKALRDIVSPKYDRIRITRVMENNRYKW